MKAKVELNKERLAVGEYLAATRRTSCVPPNDFVAKRRQGVVRGTFLVAEWGARLASRDGPTLPFSLLQNELRDHSLGGDALHPLPAVTSQCGGSAPRAGHRDQP